jgi:hypothetical protein
MSGRSRRDNASRTNKVSGVLAALKDAREGGHGKRAQTYELKQEDNVFDQVDEEQYEQLVAKRRMEAGKQSVARQNVHDRGPPAACWHGVHRSLHALRCAGAGAVLIRALAALLPHARSRTCANPMPCAHPAATRPRAHPAGDFIEDDDGNYMDMGGEEEYWQGEEGEEGDGSGRKRKDAGGAGAACVAWRTHGCMPPVPPAADTQRAQPAVNGPLHRAWCVLAVQVALPSGARASRARTQRPRSACSRCLPRQQVRNQRGARPPAPARLPAKSAAADTCLVALRHRRQPSHADAPRIRLWLAFRATPAARAPAATARATHESSDALLEDILNDVGPGSAAPAGALRRTWWRLQARQRACCLGAAVLARGRTCCSRPPAPSCAQQCVPGCTNTPTSWCRHCLMQLSWEPARPGVALAA